MTKDTSIGMGDKLALKRASLMTGSKCTRRWQLRRQDRQSQKNFDNGKIDFETRVRDARATSMLAEENEVNKEQNSSSGLGQMVGMIGGRIFQEIMYRSRKEFDASQNVGNRVQAAINAGHQHTRDGIQLFLPLMFQNGAPVSGGTGYGSGGGGLGFGAPFGVNAGMMPQIPPAATTSPFGFGAPFGVNAGMMPQMPPLPPTQSYPNPFQNALNGSNKSSFSPNMDEERDQKGATGIMLGDLGSFKAPKEIVEELKKLKKDFKNAKSLSEKQEYWDEVTSLFEENGSDFKLNSPSRNGRKRRSSMSLASLGGDGDTMREFAHDYLKSGQRGDYESDRKLKDLNKIGLTSPKEIGQFEKTITPDSINTYARILKNLGGGRSLSEAIKENISSNSGQVSDDLHDQLVSTLGSNNDQEGLHPWELEFLDTTFENSPSDMSIDEICKKLKRAAGGADSVDRNDNSLLQQKDHVQTVIRESKTDGVFGEIRPTSLYPSYINGLLGGGSNRAKVELDMKNVKYEQDGWSGKIKFKDSKGKTHHINLEGPNLSEDFTNAFEDIYKHFKESKTKGLKTANGALKFKLMELERFFEVNTIDEKLTEEEYQEDDPQHRAYGNILDDGIGASSTRRTRDGSG